MKKTFQLGLLFLGALALSLTLATAEGKCGEGKCGGDAKKEMKCAAGKKGTEKKCADGKCGDAKKELKCQDGKCATGKCKGAPKTPAKGKCG